MITMTLLPVECAEGFAERLVQTGVRTFVVQNFHQGKVRFAAGTVESARELTEKLVWTGEDYAAAAAELRNELPRLVEGRVGFASKGV